MLSFFEIAIRKEKISIFLKSVCDKDTPYTAIAQSDIEYRPMFVKCIMELQNSENKSQFLESLSAEHNFDKACVGFAKSISYRWAENQYSEKPEMAEKVASILRDKKEANYLSFSSIPFTLGCDLNIFIFDVDKESLHQTN